MIIKFLLIKTLFLKGRTKIDKNLLFVERRIENW